MLTEPKYISGSVPKVGVIFVAHPSIDRRLVMFVDKQLVHHPGLDECAPASSDHFLYSQMFPGC